VVATVGVGDVAAGMGGVMALVEAGDGVPVVSDVSARVLGAALPAALGPQPLSARAAMASPAA